MKYSIDQIISQISEETKKNIAKYGHENASYLDHRLTISASEVTLVIERLIERMLDMDSTQKDFLNSAFSAHSLMVHDKLLESRSLQNRAFSRDNLPSSVAVKSYYLDLKRDPSKYDFDEIGLSVFSQNNEDGIIMYIFSKIGFTNKRCVEIGCDLSASTVGIPEGNTINLIYNFGFDGLIVDMDPQKISAIRYFFARALPTMHFHAPNIEKNNDSLYFSPTLVTKEVNENNINLLLEESNFKGEVDLLSIDVDSFDVEIWRSLKYVSPRVVMIEINNRLPFESVIYGGLSKSTAPHDTLEYQQSRSSSLSAAIEVGCNKGYKFIGMDATLLNAFFIRNDVYCDIFPEMQARDYTGHRFNPLRDTDGAASQET